MRAAVYGACLRPLLSTACGLSLVFSSSFRFIAWITAISLASFFWFRASNSNLNQSAKATEDKTNFVIQHKPNSAGSFSRLVDDTLKSTYGTNLVNADGYFALLTCFWLSAAQLHLLRGCCHCPRCAVFLSSLAPGHNKNITKWALLKMTLLERDSWHLKPYSVRVGSILVRIYFCLPMTHQIHLRVKQNEDMPFSYSQIWWILTFGCEECLSYLEMIQQISGDRKRSTNHHLWYILSIKQKHTHKISIETRNVNMGHLGYVTTYSTSQNAERPFVDVHDGVVLSLVTIDLLWSIKSCRCSTSQVQTKLQDHGNETHLIKVQPHYNVWLHCKFVHCL